MGTMGVYACDDCFKKHELMPARPVPGTCVGPCELCALRGDTGDVRTTLTHSVSRPVHAADPHAYLQQQLVLREILRDAKRRWNHGLPRVASQNFTDSLRDWLRQQEDRRVAEDDQC